MHGDGGRAGEEEGEDFGLTEDAGREVQFFHVERASVTVTVVTVVVAPPSSLLRLALGRPCHEVRQKKHRCQ